jgi:uncharacterized membrane protein
MTTENSPSVDQLAEDLLGSHAEDLDQSQRKVVESIANSAPIAENINETIEDQLSFGDRLADKVAAFGGSWSFILMFTGIMLMWIISNTLILATNAFDPYPFILLNLGLSTVAALQAPFILMSQNRQGERDRLKAEQNYQVSLKLDLEISRLHDKLDVLAQKQDQEQERKS